MSSNPGNCLESGSLEPNFPQHPLGASLAPLELCSPARLNPKYDRSTGLDMDVLLEKSQNLTEMYDRDYCLWLDTTAKLLEAGKLCQLDIPHLLEEIQDMSRREKKALESNLEILLMHLLKYKYQPEKITNSWKYTIREHRNRIRKSLKYSPSLKLHYQKVFAECYQEGIKLAADESGLPADIFPQESCFNLEQVLDENYLPS